MYLDCHRDDCKLKHIDCHRKAYNLFFLNGDIFYVRRLYFLILESSVVLFWSDYVDFNRAHTGYRAWLGHSPEKPYPRLPLDSRYTTTITKLSGVTHNGTKNQNDLKLKPTTSHNFYFLNSDFVN